MVNIEAILSYEENCDYLSSKSVCNINIEKKEVDITSTLEIVNYDNRQLEPKGHRTQTYINNIAQGYEGELSARFDPYYNDLLKLTIHTTLNGSDIKHKSIDVYFFDLYDDKTNLSKTHLINKEPLMLDNNGTVSLKYMPHNDGVFIIKYNESTYFKEKIVEHPVTIQKIPTKVTIEKNKKTYKPKLLNDEIHYYNNKGIYVKNGEFYKELRSFGSGFLKKGWSNDLNWHISFDVSVDAFKAWGIYVYINLIEDKYDPNKGLHINDSGRVYGYNGEESVYIDNLDKYFDSGWEHIEIKKIDETKLQIFYDNNTRSRIIDWEYLKEIDIMHIGIGWGDSNGVNYFTTLKNFYISIKDITIEQETDKPKFVQLQEAADLQASVVDTYGNPPKDGVITFLTYRIHDINHPEDGVERVIGNPVMLENGIGSISYSPIQFFNQDATFFYDNKTGKLTYTHDKFSDYEVIYVDEHNYDYLKDEYNLPEITEENQLPFLYQHNANNEHYLEHILEKNEYLDECNSKIQYNYETVFGKSLNNIEIIKAVYNYDNDRYGASWKYYTQHSGYTSISVLIPTSLNISMDVENSINDNLSFEVKEDGLFHYTTNDTIVIHSKLIDADQNEVDFKGKGYAYDMDAQQYKEVPVDEYGNIVFPDDGTNWDTTDDRKVYDLHQETFLTYILEGTETKLNNNTYEFIEHKHEIEGIYDGTNNIFTGKINANTITPGIYTVTAEIDSESHYYPIGRAKGYENVHWENINESAKQNAILYEKFFYSGTKSDKIYFKIEKESLVDIIVDEDTILKDSEGNNVEYYYNDNETQYMPIKASVYVKNPQYTDFLINKNCYLYINNEEVLSSKIIRQQEQIINNNNEIENIDKLNVYFDINNQIIKNLENSNHKIFIKLKAQDIEILNIDETSEEYEIFTNTRENPIIEEIEFNKNIYFGDVSILFIIENFRKNIPISIQIDNENEILSASDLFDGNFGFIYNKNNLSAGIHTVTITCLNSGLSASEQFTINKATLIPDDITKSEITGYKSINTIIRTDGNIDNVQRNLFNIIESNNVSYPITNFTKSIQNNLIVLRFNAPIYHEQEYNFKITYNGDENYNILNPNTYSINITGTTVIGTFNKINDNEFNINYEGYNSQYIIGMLEASSTTNTINIPVLSDINGNFVINELDDWDSYQNFKLTINPLDTNLLELINNSNEESIYEDLMNYYDQEDCVPQITENNAKALLRQVEQNNNEILFTVYKSQTIW